jgi:uncharacterized membrane protein
MVSVYVPQSYNFAGQLFIFPTTNVQRLDVSSSAVMAFIISGGVTEVARPAGDAPDTSRQRAT